MGIFRFFLTFFQLLGAAYGIKKVNFIALDRTSATLFCPESLPNITSNKHCAAACLNKIEYCPAFQFNGNHCTCWRYAHRRQNSTVVYDLYIRDECNDCNAKTRCTPDFLEKFCNINDYYNVLQLLSVFLSSL